MPTAIPISQSDYEDLKQRVRILEDKIDELTHESGNEEKEPVYGSDAWWEKSDKEALESLEKGEYLEFQSAQDMISHLKKVAETNESKTYK